MVIQKDEGRWKMSDDSNELNMSENNKMKFDSAPDDKIEELQPYVRAILDALEHPEAFVTDESTLRDFMDFFYDAEEVEMKLDELREDLDVDIENDMDTIVEVAQKIKDKRRVPEPRRNATKESTEHDSILDASEDEIDCIIRQQGGDPEEYAKNGKEAVDKALRDYGEGKQSECT